MINKLVFKFVILSAKSHHWLIIPLMFILLLYHNLRSHVWHMELTVHTHLDDSCIYHVWKYYIAVCYQSWNITYNLLHVHHIFFWDTQYITWQHYHLHIGSPYDLSCALTSESSVDTVIWRICDNANKQHILVNMCLWFFLHFDVIELNSIMEHLVVKRNVSQW